MKSKNLILSVLSLLLVSSIIGCQSTSTSSSNNSGGATIEIVDTAYYLTKNGASDYIIVYPDSKKSDGNTVKAVSEVQTLFMEATGIYLPSFTDKEEFTNEKIISIGKTEQAKNISGLIEQMEAADLGQHGYLIKTVRNSVYCLGRNSKADLYSIYDFFKFEFSFECYSKDEYYIETNVETKKLISFNYSFRPSFESRTPMHFELMGYDRTRSNDYASPFNSVGGGDLCHNINALIPGSKYFATHPKWFFSWNGDGHFTQELCLNCHGDTNERQLLLQTVAKEMEWRLLEDTSTDWISFCQEDSSTVCTCDACNKDRDLYDYAETYYMAIYIRFINELARIIKAWNEEVCPERNITIFLWNYGKCRYAPVKLDENKKPILDKDGNYIPYSDEFILEENIAVYFCAFSTGNFLPVNNIYNEDDLAAIKRIKCLMRNPLMYFWCYSSAFYDYFAPYNNIETRKEYYQFMKESGAIGCYDQGQFDNEATTDWGALKAYLTSKLEWDLSLDTETLIDDFMKHYYKDAYQEMSELLAFYRNYFQYLVNEKGVEGNIVNSATTYKTAEYWPHQILKKFLDYIDKAYAKIMPLKETNPTLYNTLYKRILKESLTFRYLEILLYPQLYSADKVLEIQTQVRNDAIACGMTKKAESTPISSLFAY